MDFLSMLLGNQSYMSAGAGGMSTLLGLGAALTDHNQKTDNPTVDTRNNNARAKASGEMKMASGTMGLFSDAMNFGTSAINVAQNGISGSKGISNLLGGISGLLGMGGGIADFISGKERKKGSKSNKAKEANAGLAGGILSALGGGAGIAQGIFGLKSANTTEERRSALGNLLSGGISAISGALGAYKQWRKNKKGKKLKDSNGDKIKAWKKNGLLAKVLPDTAVDIAERADKETEASQKDLLAIGADNILIENNKRDSIY